MATKKSSQKSAKSAGKTANKKPTKTPAKSSNVKSVKAKSSRAVKTTKTATPKKFCPYHPAFGVVLLFIAAIIFSFLLGGVILEFPGKAAKNPDAPRFAKDYTLVEKSNVFQYISGTDAVELLEKGTGIIFFGFPSCPWCQAYAPKLNDLAKSYGVKKIYYLDTYDDWQNDTENYKKLTSLLGDTLQFDNVGNRHLYVPDVAFVVDGKIIANDWETSKDVLDAATPEEYWTEERVANWTEKMKANFEKYLEAKKPNSASSEPKAASEK